MPARSKKPLAERLAGFLDPTPESKDYDPEDFERMNLSSDSEAGLDSDEAPDTSRDHYVPVGKSALRKQQELHLNDPKYVGARVSRKDLYSDSDSDASSEVDSGGDGAASDEFHGFGTDGEDTAVMDKSSDDEMGESSASMASDAVSDDGDSDTDGATHASYRPSIDRSTERSVKEQLKQIEEEEQSMLKKISESAYGDVRKGHQVLKQMKLWDSFLDTRIRLQKPLVTANCIPVLSEPTDSDDVVDSPLVAEAQTLVTNILDQLLDLRVALWRRNEPEHIAVDQLALQRKRLLGETLTDAPAPKRSRQDQIALTDAIWHDIRSTNEAFVPYRNDTITKWSSKVQASAGMPHTKRLKAFNQNAMQQIEHTLQDQDRLVKRTQLKRAAYAALAATGTEEANSAGPRTKAVGAVTTEAAVQAKAQTSDHTEYDTHIFDDHDFYQHLLRELLEAKMGSTDDPIALGKRWVVLKEQQQRTQQQNRQKHAVDTKASKGRRLRFQVHEKLENFMAPMAVSTWHDSMVDELYSSLLGEKKNLSEVGGAVADDGTSGSEEDNDETTQATDGFAIFG
ncbi:rRNA-processing protein bfr2 [Dimargaris verticillata]|uniref:Protein BFR2 n=1 Tax=Dimargaris verticillata TaxID=2761393 RepID=A0A9W8EBC6_9FUNG|nr:rRNA-processing protein bfr2 [Dimargaris verticillata]